MEMSLFKDGSSQQVIMRPENDFDRQVLKVLDGIQAHAATTCRIESGWRSDGYWNAHNMNLYSNRERESFDLAVIFKDLRQPEPNVIPDINKPGL